jgi:hypothetical protein
VGEGETEQGKTGRESEGRLTRRVMVLLQDDMAYALPRMNESHILDRKEHGCDNARCD